MVNVVRAFLDTSVIFAAAFSESGGSRLVFKLGEAGAVQVIVSRQVLREAEGVLKRKAPEVMPLFSVLLDRARVEIAPTVARKEARKLQTIVGHAGDAQIVADALAAKADFLVTLDKAHLLENRALAGDVPFVIGAPGEFLAWYRARIRGEEANQ